MTQNNSSDSSNEKGGGVILDPPSKKQISPAKNWCFTLNNYSEDDISSIINQKNVMEYIIGKEVGEECGTPHLQGYIIFNKKLRPKKLFNEKIHWEKAKGNKQSNIDYCSKEGDIITNFKLPEKVKTIEPVQFHQWQLCLLDILNKKPHDRNIHWLYGSQGCGKTTFMKYCCIHLQDCLILSGGSSNMKNGIIEYEKKNGIYPKIIFSNIGYDKDLKRISYSGYEDIKDMCFYSGKYEGGMVLGNPCHLIIFANFEPESVNKKFLVTNIDKENP